MKIQRTILSALAVLTAMHAVSCAVPVAAPGAELSSLVISSGTLNPVFRPDTTSYSTTVPSDVNSIAVTATAEDPAADIMINGEGVASGQPSSQIALVVGANAITITVTAQDGATSKAYTVTVSRAGSSNADLSALTVNEGALSPTFSPSTTSYTVSVANSIASITVTGTRADAGATVSANNGVPQSLVVGANAITITVTAQDGMTTKGYTVTVTRSADYLSPTIGTLVYVAGGTFKRDSVPGNLSTVSAFRVSRDEVTRAQFLGVMGTDPGNPAFSGGTGDPVQQVNWYHAIAFCNKLSLAEGLQPVYSVAGVNFGTLAFSSIPTSGNATWDAATADWAANGYRLPTEMEWMWAAMGATSGWGSHAGGVFQDGIDKAFAGYRGVASETGLFAVFGYSTTGEGGRTTTQRTNPVESRSANEVGLFDMSGNVMEWTWDWYATWPTGSVTDYRGGSASSGLRLSHGGDWYDGSTSCAVKWQEAWNPALQTYRVGFRVVRR